MEHRGEKSLSNLLTDFNSSKDLNKEFEISVGFISETGHIAFKIIYEKLFNYYKQKAKGVEIIQNLDVYYSNGVRKTLSFIKGVNQKKDVYIKKKNLGFTFIKRSIKNVKNIKLKLSNENNVDNGESSVSGQDIMLMRFKLRVRFHMDKYYTDLDLVKTLNKDVLATVSVKNVKDSVFKEYEVLNILNGVEYSLFDEIKLEFEFRNDNNSLSLEDVFQPINELSNIYNTDIDTYQKYIFLVARYIITNKNYLENFRFKSGLKKLLNNVIEIDSDTYYKKVQSDIVNNFYITDKIDGKRCILILKEYKESNGIVGNKWEISLLSNDLKTFNNGKPSLKKGEKLEFVITILDCEMLVDGDKINLFAFDLIVNKNTRLAGLNFSKRYEYLSDAVEHVNKYTDNNISLYEKTHILLNENWKQQIKEFYTKEREYDIDGIIFTPNDNSDYSKMVGYKWKPAEHSTIDFYIKKISDKVKTFNPFNSIKLKKEENIYVLFSGISKRDYDKFNMSLIPSYNMIFDIKQGDIGNIWKNPLIPIQFSTSDNPGNYIYVGKDKDLDNKIGEFGWNHIDNKWEIKRIRTDRDVELARGEYYGNYFKIAESIWFSIMNPLTFENLLEENKGYFAEDDNNLYKEQRNYNSFVKTKLLSTVVNETENKKDMFVIDLASGKGQDMVKLSNLKINHTLFVDNDKNAISEIMKRKHGLRTDHNMKISIAHADLSLDYKNTIKSITKSLGETPEDKTDMVVMNFAIHYFSESTESIINLINLVNNVLKKGGRFIFTCFDGDKIDELCGDNGWDAAENDVLKYSIRKISSEKVKLILPFSKGEYYEEYLVRLNKLNKILEDNGFSKEVQNSFNGLFKDYSKIENLSDDDKKFVSLYSYSVYRKNTGGNIVWKPSKNILQELGYDNNIEGGAERIESSNSDILDNVPNTNKIIILCNQITLSKEKKKHIAELFEEYGYKNLDTNARLRKKVFIIADSGAVVKRHTTAKVSSNVSVMMLKEGFINDLEDYIKIILKTPILDILIRNECIIMSLDNYMKKIEFETSEFHDMFNSSSPSETIRIE